MSHSPLEAIERKRILIVEDDQTNRVLFTDYLSRNGYNVMALPDGTTLLADIESFQPGILILDIGLPYIDGLTLLRRLRTVERWQRLPVILMSTYVFRKDHEPIQSSSIKYYLTKPIRLQALITVLRQISNDLSDER